jgi:4-oxalocrotonate tautomerase
MNNIRLAQLPNKKRKEKTMPHVIVKLWPGESQEKKQRLADKIAKDVMDVFKFGEESVSVSMEEVDSKNWERDVYKPDILGKWQSLYKKPGYSY